MKIKEMIELLSSLDQEMDVLMVSPCEPGYLPVGKLKEVYAYDISYSDSKRIAFAQPDDKPSTKTVIFFAKDQRGQFQMRNAVVLLAINSDRVLSVSRGLLRPWSMTLPGGKVEPGETLEEALRRETQEEVGVQLGMVWPVYERKACSVVDYNVTYYRTNALCGSPPLFTKDGWVKWSSWDTLFKGPFGRYNMEVYDHLYGKPHLG